MTRRDHHKWCPTSACSWQMWVFALLFLLTVAAAAQQRHAPSAGSGGQFQISGTVVNAVNEQPLANAYVTITAVQDAAARTIKTGPDGAFRFDGVRPGKYQLSAERRGFASQQYQQHETSLPRLQPALAWIPATSSSASCPTRPFPGASPTSRAMQCAMRASCLSVSK